MGKLRSKEKKRKAKELVLTLGSEKFTGKNFDEVKGMLKELGITQSKLDRNIIASEIVRRLKTP